jgi:hypothetical protein
MATNVDTAFLTMAKKLIKNKAKNASSDSNSNKDFVVLKQVKRGSEKKKCC